MVTLTNVGSAYDATEASNGLGFADVDLTNVVAIRATIRVNRIGTGTISWQLWNETDRQQIGVITDAVNGRKYLTATWPVAIAGVKRLRWRCLSSVATDDPVFLGSSVELVR